METTCSDVCESVCTMLEGLGFKFDFNEANGDLDHDQVLIALDQVKFVHVREPLEDRVNAKLKELSAAIMNLRVRRHRHIVVWT